MSRIRVTKDNLCGGCDYCEVICSFYHHGVCNPEKSAIRAVRVEPGIDIPSVCHQCHNAPCAAACPVGALYRDEKLGAVLVDEKKCFGCGDCVPACPFGEIFMHPDLPVPVKCDLCHGDPKCVKYCFKGAIDLDSDSFFAHSQQERVEDSAKKAQRGAVKQTAEKIARTAAIHIIY